MAFSEAFSGGVADERAMVVGGRRVTEGAEEEKLAEGGLDEVFAPHDFGDAGLGIVHGAGELVTGDSVFAPHEEVAEVAAGDGGLRAEVAVVEDECFVVGDAEAPVAGEVEWGGRSVGRRTPVGRVKRFVVFAAFVRGGDGGFGEFAAGAVAGEDQAGGVEAGEGVAVGGETLRLGDDGFFPRKAEPAEVFEHGGDELGAAAGGVEVVVAEEQASAGGAGAFMGGPKRERVAEVQVAGGRGGEAADVGRRREQVEC